MKAFYPQRNTGKKEFEMIKKNYNDLTCISDKTVEGKPLDLYGLGFGEKHQSLEISYKPCQP